MALERIAKETGATKQSMIGLAVSAWIHEYDYLPAEGPKTPEIGPQSPKGHDESMLVVERMGVEVGWYRGRITKRQGTRRIVFTAHRLHKGGELIELPHQMEYEVLPDEGVYEEGEE